MDDEEISRQRIERLRLAIERLTEGNVTAFGVLLGYKDGAFVRQMLSGSRAVSEKTVRKIEEMRNMAGWFQPGDAPATPQWPFPKVPLEQVLALSEDDRGYVQRRLMQAIAECEPLDKRQHTPADNVTGGTKTQQKPAYPLAAVPPAPRPATPLTPALNREDARVKRRGFTGDTKNDATRSIGGPGKRPQGTKRPR